MKLDTTTARQQLVEIGQKIEEKGLIVGPGGNISCRLGRTMLIKASGVSFEDAVEEDYVAVDLETATLIDGKRKPSSEFRFHRGCYLAREDVKAVVHTHPPHVTGLISAGGELGPLTPDFVVFFPGGVPVTDYVVPTGRELADVVVEAIREHDAVLLRNHGAVTVGHNLREAYYRNLFLEATAISIMAARTVGGVRFLSDEEVAEVDRLASEHYRRSLLRGNP